MTHPKSVGGLTGEELYLLKPVCKDWKKCLLPQVCRRQHKATRVMTNQGNMTPTNETNGIPMFEPKEMEIYEFSDKEFKIIFLNTFYEL